MEAKKHSCYQCRAHDGPDTFRGRSMSEGPELETIETTLAEDGGDIFFTSGYSAREIAERHAAANNARVFVNTVSRKVRRPDLTVPVAYAVAKSPVYTLRGPDAFHSSIYRCYWRPL